MEAKLIHLKTLQSPTQTLLGLVMCSFPTNVICGEGMCGEVLISAWEGVRL